MLDNAVINLGLKPSEFWDMRFVDYLRFVIHKAKEEANEWDRFRCLYSIINNVNASKKSEQKKPKEMLPLWIDKWALLNKKPIIPPTEEEKLQMLKKVGK